MRVDAYFISIHYIIFVTQTNQAFAFWSLGVWFLYRFRKTNFAFPFGVDSPDIGGNVASATKGVRPPRRRSGFYELASKRRERTINANINA